MGELASDLKEARSLCLQAIEDGSAFERFQRMVELQGGDPIALTDVTRLPTARTRIDVPSRKRGCVTWLDARPIGHATMLLGAGRARVESKIDPAVGIVLNKKVGDRVEQGESLCTLHVNDESALSNVLEIVKSAYVIEDAPPVVHTLIVERL